MCGVSVCVREASKTRRPMEVLRHGKKKLHDELDGPKQASFIVNIKLVVTTVVGMHCIFRVTTRSGMYNFGIVTQCTVCETTGFRRGVVDTVALLGCYITYIGSGLSTFRDSIPFQTSSVKQAAWTLKMELTNCPQTSVCAA